MAKQFETDNKFNTVNQIGVGTVITGDINSNGDIRIDGSLTGNLSTKGKVVVGESGTIKGEISCKNSVIEGKIEGKVKVAELLALKATCQITGDLKTSRLAIEPGARFTGNCNMSSNTNTNVPEQSTQKPKEEEERKPK